MIKNTKKRHIFSFILSLGVSIAMVVYLLSGTDLEKLGQLVRNISVPALLVYIAIATIQCFVRAWRYGIIINAPELKYRDIFLVTLVRNLFVDFLPSRLGELVYIFILRQKYRLPLEKATSSFVLSTLFDFITVAPIIGVAMFFVQADSTVELTKYIFVLGTGLTMLLVAVFKLPFFIKLFDRMVLKKVKNKYTAKLAGKLDELAEEIDTAHQRGIYTKLFVISFGMRLLKYISLFALAAAFFSAWGVHWYDLSFFHCVLGTAGAEFTGFLPIKGLAGIGSWESGWAAVFALLDYPKDWGILTGFGVHLTTQIFEYTLGTVAMAIIYLKKNTGQQA